MVYSWCANLGKFVAFSNFSGSKKRYLFVFELLPLLDHRWVLNKQKSIIRFALVTCVLLMLVKFASYLLTNSNAILTDAMESIENVVASGFAFYSIHLAARPKDQNHPYGHGKVEFFSVFLEGGLIFIAGVLILGK